MDTYLHTKQFRAVVLNQKINQFSLKLRQYRISEYVNTRTKNKFNNKPKAPAGGAARGEDIHFYRLGAF